MASHGRPLPNRAPAQAPARASEYMFIELKELVPGIQKPTVLILGVIGCYSVGFGVTGKFRV